MAPNSNQSKESSSPINTLGQLIDALNNRGDVGYNDILRVMEVPFSEFEAVSSWSDQTYTRNCIICEEDFELILLCWEPNQVTKIHDHGGQECWVKILKGELKETIYEHYVEGEPVPVRSFIGKPGDIRYMVDFMGCHRLENTTNERALSLHLYAKPIETCNIYDEEKELFVPKNMEYD